ncbi:tetratricopeptide repeat protein [Sabulicella glaciei]|uniref:Tetratricopeptide repeat protein n=1 Tax=Sabulicella glaciei TaxID=2984948 RepID=A0ABT3NSF4_9PROT|nr:tetratricopeptide repeat protein [Roseococcus sp. MDT2-1-1]
MRSPLPLMLGFASSLALVGAAGWWLWPTSAQPERIAANEIPSLPLPPEPPRIADGEDYENCLALLRRDVDEALRFALAWEATGGGEGARHCLALATIGTGEPSRAAERLERLAAGSRAGNLARAAVYGQAAQAWMMADAPNRAFAAITIALTLSPFDAELLVDRSVILASQRRYGEALEDLDRVLAIEPDRAEALVFRAAALRHLERPDEAREAVERALTLAPDNAEALLERGILRQTRGDMLGAQADWRRAIELAPDSAAAELAQQNLSLSEFGPARR